MTSNSTEKPIFQGEEIKSLIPQRSPIIMVDTFYEATEESCKTGLTIISDNIFCEDGTLLETGLIEHIAQSASAFAGYTALKNEQPTPIGFIGEVKKFQLTALPKSGDRLITEIKILSEIMNVSLLTAETFLGNDCIATCQMKIFIQESKE
ncbi:MAG: hydroxymyristoyl-ACP dehydratase [Paludibacteraceae bacterium]|nr:hydroxymyristoyl-ACP dehydratase [Paludibacteraceae bacterium]